MSHRIALRSIKDGREGAGNHYSFDGGGILLDCLENTCRSDDRGIEEVLFHVGDVKVEGRRGVDYGFEAGDFDGFIEGAFDCDVGDDAEIKFRGGCVGVGFFDLLGFFFGADRCDDRMAVLEEDVEDVCCDEAATAFGEVSMRSPNGVKSGDSGGGGARFSG